MSTAMETIETQTPAKVEAERLALARLTVAKDATEAEFALFVYDCQRRGVHPLDRLIHFTKRQGRYVPVTSIDLFRSQADATGMYAGNADPVFVDGEKYPESATVTVRKIVQGAICDFTATARWKEYSMAEDAKEGFMWRKMPHTMLGKCAEALALRKAFPKELGGLYTKDEMDQAGPPQEAKPPVEMPKRRFNNAPPLPPVPPPLQAPIPGASEPLQAPIPGVAAAPLQAPIPGIAGSIPSAADAAKLAEARALFGPSHGEMSGNGIITLRGQSVVTVHPRAGKKGQYWEINATGGQFVTYDGALVDAFNSGIPVTVGYKEQKTGKALVRELVTVEPEGLPDEPIPDNEMQYGFEGV